MILIWNDPSQDYVEGFPILLSVHKEFLDFFHTSIFHQSSPPFSALYVLRGDELTELQF